MSEMDLLRETARRLGYERTGKDVSSRLAKELDAAIKKSIVTVVDERFEIART